VIFSLVCLVTRQLFELLVLHAYADTGKDALLRWHPEASGSQVDLPDHDDAGPTTHRPGGAGAGTAVRHQEPRRGLPTHPR
jgi:hypothetical protein